MVKFGIYEKALLDDKFEESLKLAHEVGYSFWELAIDNERKARLDWNNQEIDEIKKLCSKTSMPIFNMVLSLHRDYPLGAVEKETREAALQYLFKSIDLAVKLGIRTIQLAGYYSKKEEIPGLKELYIQSLKEGAAYASANGVLLGIENMDYDFIDIESIMDVIKEVNNPYLKLFLDVGNFAANELDPIQQLLLGKEDLIALHLKETKKSEYRRVRFGDGIVKFKEIFHFLTTNNYNGYFGVEMWNDNNPHSLKEIEHSINWLKNQM